tara:strand:+ start:1395 stop:1718 length:324 start_codon:yes stop_codon:yes gene_type:complete
MSYKDFFTELEKFLPQYTSPTTAIVAGSIVALICTFVLYIKVNDTLKKYSDDDPMKKVDKYAMYTGSCIIVTLAFFFVSDAVFTFQDINKNLKWYVYKYKYFPKLLS